jgi:phage tail-like protein
MANITPRYINQRPSAAADPLRNFRFLVKFVPYGDGLKNAVNFSPTLGFISVGGLGMQTDAIQYREGGFHATMHQLPGQQQFAQVSLVRGMTLGGTQHWKWWTRIFTPGFGVTNDSPQLTEGFRCEIVIDVLAHPQPLTQDFDTDRDDHVAARIRLMNAWPTTLSYGDLNAGDSAIWVESMTIVHEGMHIKFSEHSKNFDPRAESEWGESLGPVT